MIQFVAAETGTFDGGAKLTIGTPTTPTVLRGDKLLAVVYDTEPGNTINSPPTGWTLVHNEDFPGFGQIWVYEFDVDEASAASPVWEFDATLGEVVGVIAAYRGACIDALNVDASSSASGTTHDAPSISVLQYSSYLVTAHCAPIAGSWTKPFQMTERADYNSSVQADACIEISDREAITAGATGAKTATLSGASIAVTASIELRVPPTEQPAAMVAEGPGGIGLV